jgi:sugar (pentulose or hexulose) kinase
MLTGFTGGKILWMKQNEPENYARTVRIINPKDYIRFRLSGEKITEVSDASGTGFFDVRTRSWSTALLDKLGIDPDCSPRLWSPPTKQAASASKQRLSPACLRARSSRAAAVTRCSRPPVSA